MCSRSTRTWVCLRCPLDAADISGMPVRKQHLDELLNGPGGSQNRQGVNFTMFLTMMSEHLSAFDHDSELLEAFGCFDENDDGTVSIEEMHRWLGQFGERMNQEEVIFGQLGTWLTFEQIDTFLSGGFVDKNGRFNYREWVNLIRINESD